MNLKSGVKLIRELFFASYSSTSYRRVSLNILNAVIVATFSTTLFLKSDQIKSQNQYVDSSGKNQDSAMLCL